MEWKATRRNLLIREKDGAERMVPERVGKWVLLILVGILLQLDPSLADDGSKRYALLIGGGSYQQWAPLVNPIPDVRTLEAELRHRYGFLAEVLENPSREEIIAKLRRYLRQDYGPEDQLIVVFAGHGTYDEISRIGYLVASDSATRSRDPNFVSLLNYPWLLTLIDHIDCPNVLVIVDACYSGSLQDATPASRGGTGSGQRDWVRQFLTAGGKEYVPDGDPDRHTPFVRHLLEGLRSRSSGGALTLDELYAGFVRRAEPTPKKGSFGRHSGSATFTLTARGAAPPALASTSRGSVAPAPTSRSTPAAKPKLRAEAAHLNDRALARAFQRLEIYDKARNPEGNYPNQLRLQSKQEWEVVVDLESSLMWQQSGSEFRMAFEEAADYIRKLNRSGHAGYRDWRLPTMEELASLMEPSRESAGLFVSSRFDPEQETCWSVDRDGTGNYGYFVSFNSGRAILGFGNRKAFVRAVRTN